MTRIQQGKIAGVLSLLLIGEMYVQDLLIHASLPYSFGIFVMQTLVAIVLGIIAAELHSRRWYFGVGLSAINLVLLVLGLAV